MPSKLQMKPFLKWAGGKHRVYPHLEPYLKATKRLIEPFTGSAAVFLNTPCQAALLGDNNPILIRLYQFLQQEGNDFIEYCRSFFTVENNEKSQYLKHREYFNLHASPREQAALFLYLNRHCYNGLCRFNKRQAFNTPFGRYPSPYFPENEMRYFHEKSQIAQFKTANFSEIMQEAKAGDVIYCDPPYTPLSQTANFTQYTSSGFTHLQQETLAKLSEKLSQERGIRILISNHDTAENRRLYQNAQDIITFSVPRTISQKKEKREPAKELLAIY